MVLNGIINAAKSFFGRCVGGVITRSAIETLRKCLRSGAWASITPRSIAGFSIVLPSSRIGSAGIGADHHGTSAGKLTRR
jgi:hypothetical protein